LEGSFSELQLLAFDLQVLILLHELLEPVAGRLELLVQDSRVLTRLAVTALSHTGTLLQLRTNTHQ
jgi:hypothetical protein